jgi:hypothetical protein
LRQNDGLTDDGHAAGGHVADDTLRRAILSNKNSLKDAI